MAPQIPLFEEEDRRRKGAREHALHVNDLQRPGDVWRSKNHNQRAERVHEPHQAELAQYRPRNEAQFARERNRDKESDNVDKHCQLMNKVRVMRHAVDHELECDPV
eukprot:Amastigsp_a841554_96.p4 type:complete len:106 gc:universal Amastigsp_a841554_96:430-113(-)